MYERGRNPGTDTLDRKRLAGERNSCDRKMPGTERCLRQKDARDTYVKKRERHVPRGGAMSDPAKVTETERCPGEIEKKRERHVPGCRAMSDPAKVTERQKDARER